MPQRIVHRDSVNKTNCACPWQDETEAPDLRVAELWLLSAGWCVYVMQVMVLPALASAGQMFHSPLHICAGLRLRLLLLHLSSSLASRRIDPRREVLQLEEGEAPGGDGQHYSRHPNHVHTKASLHHVLYLAVPIAEDDGIWWVSNG